MKGIAAMKRNAMLIEKFPLLWAWSWLITS